jgi:hypothetical protein
VEERASQVRVEDLEDALGQVGEIKAARVVTSQSGAIEEIHVLALPTKTAKQLVRDIESTLMASFGINVDHKKISVAQLGRAVADEAVKPTADEPVGDVMMRPKIVSINASVTGLSAGSTVTLEIGGVQYVGSAEGPASQSGRLRMLALAALDALEQWSGEMVNFALEDVAIVQLGHEKVAVACIVLVTNFGEQTFTGSSLVRQNEKDAIVRATLDALNRRIGFLTTA